MRLRILLCVRGTVTTDMNITTTTLTQSSMQDLATVIQRRRNMRDAGACPVIPENRRFYESKSQRYAFYDTGL